MGSVGPVHGAMPSQGSIAGGSLAYADAVADKARPMATLKPANRNTDGMERMAISPGDGG
jgi:hypothetical protein